MLPNDLILCHPILHFPSIFPSSRVFSNESTHHIRWPKNWSFSFSIIPSNLNTKCEYQKPSWQHISRFSWSQSLKKKDQHHVHSLVIRKFLTSLIFHSLNIWLQKKKKKKMKAFIGKEWESVVLDENMLQTIQNQESKRYIWPPEPVEVSQILSFKYQKTEFTL